MQDKKAEEARQRAAAVHRLREEIQVAGLIHHRGINSIVAEAQKQDFLIGI